MKAKEQKVEKYSDLFYTKDNMQRNIKDGWLVVACVSHSSNNAEKDGILVVYERDLEHWN